MPISPQRGRSTRTFRRIRAQTLAESTICVVCAHPGSDAVDHIVARSVDPGLAEDADNLAPIHHEPCSTCGRRCNREKGTRTLASMRTLRTSRTW